MFAKRRPPVDHLEDLDPFRACSRHDLERIASVSDVVDIEPGYVLTREGRSGSECFVVTEGEAAVFVGGKQVARLERGALIGEMSLIDGGPRSATVVALTPMRVVLFARPAFSATVASTPAVASAVLTALSGRLRSAQVA
jgi:CRP/FNR family cyclic AMP-dependent transcriptional regulator